jgi:hypothetical protein
MVHKITIPQKNVLLNRANPLLITSTLLGVTSLVNKHLSKSATTKLPISNKGFSAIDFILVFAALTLGVFGIEEFIKDTKSKKRFIPILQLVVLDKYKIPLTTREAKKILSVSNVKHFHTVYIKSIRREVTVIREVGDDDHLDISLLEYVK